jgi:hypothetical protein
VQGPPLVARTRFGGAAEQDRRHGPDPPGFARSLWRFRPKTAASPHPRFIWNVQTDKDIIASQTAITDDRIAAFMNQRYLEVAYPRCPHNCFAAESGALCRRRRRLVDDPSHARFR